MWAVIWKDQALDDLADALVQSDLATQDTIERLIKQFNAELAADPLQVGESRTGNRRIAHRAPCAISFLVDSTDQVVRVTHFWTY
jgi:hypothetical protein